MKYSGYLYLCHGAGDESSCAIEPWRILGIGTPLKITLEDVVSEIFRSEQSTGGNKCLGNVIGDAFLRRPAENSQMDLRVSIDWSQGWVLFKLQWPSMEILDGDIR
jgi:hypothetical protein